MSYARGEFSRPASRRGPALWVVAALCLMAGATWLAGPRRRSAWSPQRREIAARSGAATLYAAVAAFRQDTGRFPTAAEGLGVLVTPPVAAGGWRGPYLESARLPNDPWGRPYVYVAPAGTSHCRILSVGPDGVQGTADDVAP